MEVSKHIAFSTRSDHAFLLFLNQHDIPVDQDEDHDIAAIDIYESNPHWPWISNYVKEHRLICLSDLEFTKEELLAAEWMRVRTVWRTGYPEPVASYGYQNITYTKEHYCENCGNELVQQAPFRLKKVPNWGRRHFFAPFWVEEELFISDHAKEILVNTGITGISFQQVLKKNGKDCLPDIQQLVIESVLDEGLDKDQSCIEEILVCPQCQKKKFVYNLCGKLAFKREIFANANDIVKTYERFGNRNLYAVRKIIINQRTYRTLVDNGLDRSLQFYPIDLV